MTPELKSDYKAGVQSTWLSDPAADLKLNRLTLIKLNFSIHMQEAINYKAYKYTDAKEHPSFSSFERIREMTAEHCQ